MNTIAKETAKADIAVSLTKDDPRASAFVVTGLDRIALRAGIVVTAGDKVHTLDADTSIAFVPAAAGTDFVVEVWPDGSLHATERLISGIADEDAVTIGGFHFAPGGNAAARSGGDAVPAINPFSCWDLNFRPACPDPYGMTLVDGKFWCDIYLTTSEHLRAGTSRFGATIADGRDHPEKPGGGAFPNFNYHTATAVLAHHGKGLLSLDEFFAAAYGVTEKTACDDDPVVTGLDAPRTSKWGVMQATGNLWTWGHDGDPDEPRASLCGGSWWSDGYAGSRRANVGCWPEDSLVYCGARGRSDHLMLV